MALKDGYFCDGVVGRGGQLRLEPRRDVGEELSHGVLLAVVGGDVEGGQALRISVIIGSRK